MPATGFAPTFTVPAREIVALEHPMIVKNIDKGLKTLGSGVPLQQLLSADGYEGCFPLYLRPVDPACAPLLSNNTPSSNVLLKITVPKRTGRKRKRGSDDPYMLDTSITPHEQDEVFSESSPRTSLRSHSRLDNPRNLLRSLRDNVDKYRIEPVGSIDQTHRYRGITDFHYSTSHGEFMTKFRETILPGNVESLRKFKLDPSRGVKLNDELVPPPTFSDKTIPANWGYHQNSNIKESRDHQTGETILTNHSRAVKINTYYVPFDTPTVPTHPPSLPTPDPILQSLLTELHIALAERPIWTRRAILNRIPRSNPGIYLLKPAIQYVAYQFRGGPWRDAIVRYGVDPRSDPAYRIYQTLFFKIVDVDDPPPSTTGTTGTTGTGNGTGTGTAAAFNKPWQDKRSEYYSRKAPPSALTPYSHIFTGTTVSLDGKVWQVCDITDPLLVRLLTAATLRTVCDLRSDGWYCNGSWAKVRAVMRTKISAIRLGRLAELGERGGEQEERFFGQTLALPDVVEGKVRVAAYLPGLGGEGVADSGDGDGDDDGAGREDADAGSEGLGWGDGLWGGAGSVLEATTRGKASRRRKSRDTKRRNRKRRDGKSKNMGFGKGRPIQKRGDGVGIGPPGETVVGGVLEPSVVESTAKGVDIPAPLDANASVRVHLTTAIEMETGGGAAEKGGGNEILRGEGEDDEDDDNDDDYDNGEGEDGDGGEEENEDEEEEEDDDEDEYEHDGELGGEGW